MEELDRTLELRIWREATTIFMTSGHGGCGPYGLALSAAHRGFGVELVINDERMPLLDSVRSEEKKEVMRLVQQDMLDEIQALGIPLNYGSLSVMDLKARFDAGGVPVVLISSYRIYGEKFPHWVVVTGFDEHFIYVHDPFVDYENGRDAAGFHQHAHPPTRFRAHGPLRKGRAQGRAGDLSQTRYVCPEETQARMSDHMLLIEQPGDWKPHFPEYPVMLARDYLTQRPETPSYQLRVINLCRSSRYLSVGYYCSLLAEARNHKVVPTVRTLQDLSRKSIYSLDTEDIDRKVAKVLGRKRRPAAHRIRDDGVLRPVRAQGDAGDRAAAVLLLSGAAVQGGVQAGRPVAHRCAQAVVPERPHTRPGGGLLRRPGHLPQAPWRKPRGRATTSTIWPSCRTRTRTCRLPTARR
jgi:hypothetical protein